MACLVAVRFGVCGGDSAPFSAVAPTVRGRAPAWQRSVALAPAASHLHPCHPTPAAAAQLSAARSSRFLSSASGCAGKASAQRMSRSPHWPGVLDSGVPSPLTTLT